MNGKWALKLTTSAVVLSGLTGCISQASVQATVKAPFYQRKTSRLFVVANMGAGLSNGAADHAGEFATLLKNSLDQCGTETRVFVRNPSPQLSLTDTTPAIIALTMGNFKPDAILEINWKLHQFDNHGGNFTSYILALHDSTTHAIVWKAEINAISRWYPAEIFTETVINGMKKDALIDATCVPPPHEKML